MSLLSFLSGLRCAALITVCLQWHVKDLQCQSYIAHWLNNFNEICQSIAKIMCQYEEFCDIITYYQKNKGMNFNLTIVGIIFMNIHMMSLVSTHGQQCLLNIHQSLLE